MEGFPGREKERRQDIRTERGSGKETVEKDREGIESDRNVEGAERDSRKEEKKEKEEKRCLGR